MEPKDEIKQRLDVAEVIGEYLQLKPAGSGSFKAVCPFHSEKTPSFYISQEKQIWHCFGCDKGGDFISFVMEIEGIDFLSALKQLGKKAGVVIPEFAPDVKRDDKQILYDLNELAGRFYETILNGHELGNVARTYIQTRGIDDNLTKKFQLGCAPDRWNSLSEFLAKRGVAEKQMILSGLAKKTQAGDKVIDRFRDRLMIALHDSTGRVIGFTGRLLRELDDKSGPKYLNSPETLIYHKSDVLYGLHLAKKSVRQEKSIIIVEGNLDVIASHKAGIENVVASSGTALTESQLRQLKNITNRLLFCFDADPAGFAAAKRGIRLAQQMNFQISVIPIPVDLGKDPDDVVRKNPEAWINLIKNPIHIMQYYITKGTENFDLSNIDSKKKLVSDVLFELKHLPDQVEKEHWLQQLSDITRTDINVLRQVLTGMKNEKSNKIETKNSVRPATAKKVSSRIDNVASIIIGILLNNENLISELIAKAEIENFPAGLWRQVYKKIVLEYNQGVKSDSTPISKIPLYNRLDDQLTEEVRSALLKTEELTSQMDDKQVREELYRHLDILINASRKERRKFLEADIRQAEMSGDKELLQHLLKEYRQLLSN